jgi:hypothetical protein
MSDSFRIVTFNNHCDTDFSRILEIPDATVLLGVNLLATPRVIAV